MSCSTPKSTENIFHLRYIYIYQPIRIYYGNKKSMLCVRFCNKDHVLRQNCRKKVSSLWMGRLYRQDSGGNLMSIRVYTKQEIAKLRDCQCTIPCLVYCNVVIRQLQEE